MTEMRNRLTIWLISFLGLLQVFGVCFAQPKTLAPGVLKVIPANIDARDSYSLPLPLEGLNAAKYSPNYSPVLDTLSGQTENVIFFRDVWQYEFGFTGLRQIELELPGEKGLEKQNVWYLVYRIRDTGKNLSYEKVIEDQRFDHQKNQLKRNSDDFKIEGKFLPHFYLNGWVKPAGGEYGRVSYRDQIAPNALNKIRIAEDRNRVLLDKVEMMNVSIPKVKSAVDDGIWGVAIWQNVDPRIDFVSVNVRGLTNAYRIDSTGTDRKFRYRNLQLNFWRPGDRIGQRNDDVIYGIPLVDDPLRQIEICQKYQLPGPLIRGYVVSKSANQNVLAAEIDAEIQFSTFESSITPDLDSGKIPPKLRAAFEKSGIQLESGTVQTMVTNEKWQLQGTMSGEKIQLVVAVEPQYWEPNGDGIRFINSLEHLWVYR